MAFLHDPCFWNPFDLVVDIYQDLRNRDSFVHGGTLSALQQSRVLDKGQGSLSYLEGTSRWPTSS